MKRSEMVKIVAQKLLELYRLDFSTQERAEFLLKCIESAGMLPPKSLDTVTLKKGLVRGYTMMFEWDDENES